MKLEKGKEVRINISKEIVLNGEGESQFFSTMSIQGIGIETQLPSDKELLEAISSVIKE